MKPTRNLPLLFTLALPLFSCACEGIKPPPSRPLAPPPEEVSAKPGINDEFLVAFAIAPQQIKQEPWYPSDANPVVFMANLELTFYGHEEGSEHEVAIPAGTTVTFLPEIAETN